MDNEKLVAMGRRLYDRRKELELTQEQLAEKADLHNVTLSNIELGKREPELDTFISLCNALDMSLDYVLTGHSYQYTSLDDIDRIAHKLEKLSLKQRNALEILIDSMLG